MATWGRGGGSVGFGWRRLGSVGVGWGQFVGEEFGWGRTRLVDERVSCWVFHFYLAVLQREAAEPPPLVAVAQPGAPAARGHPPVDRVAGLGGWEWGVG
jgi:hypothetical protein